MAMKKGCIFDIKQFAVYDGPGTRQTVFFKGCPLDCSWCHNPEGKNAQPELMVSWASCIHCDRCKDVCVHPEKCVLCGSCIDVCPLHLRHIAGEWLDSDTLISRLAEYADYYEANQGGVTFSGGEPLMQPEFLIEVLEKCKWHKAIETSGFAEPETYRAVYSRSDFIIQDFKIFDESRHVKYVGASNRNILANIEFLCRGSKPFVIRVPLIPGVTDTLDNYRAIAGFLKGAKALRRVELLKYVKAAGAKYEMVNRRYTPKFDPEREVRVCPEIFEKAGIKSLVLK